MVSYNSGHGRWSFPSLTFDCFVDQHLLHLMSLLKEFSDPDLEPHPCTRLGGLWLWFCSAPPGADTTGWAACRGQSSPLEFQGVTFMGGKKAGTGRHLRHRQKCQLGGELFGIHVLLPMGDVYNGCPGQSVWAPKLLGREWGGLVGAAPPWRDELCSGSSWSKHIVNDYLSIPFI